MPKVKERRRAATAPGPTFELVDASRVNPVKWNPRKDLKPNDREYKKIERSLDDFGMVEPLVWNKRTGNLVGGHQRFKILTAKGHQNVWVSVVDLPESKEKALNLVLNKVQGNWDQVKLKALLSSFSGDFDLTMTGFAESELKGLINFTGKAGKTKPDDVPEKESITPVAKKGEVWALGDHRLYCGDSLDPKALKALFGAKKASLVATDPPYLVDYTGDRPKNSGKNWTHVFNEAAIEGQSDFPSRWIFAAKTICRLDAGFYVWHASARASDLVTAFQKNGLIPHQQIIWAKPTAVFGFSFYPWQHEPCLFGWLEGHKPFHDGDMGHHLTTVWGAGYDRTMVAVPGAVTVIQMPKDAPAGETSLWRADWDGKRRIVGNEHPTQKPTELFAIPMRKHTKAGDVVFEPFSGSGSQIIAAERLGRICYAVEIEPYFVDVAVRRWENFTGKKAKVTGRI